MSLQTRLEAFAVRVAQELKAIRVAEAARVVTPEAHDFSMVGTLTTKVGTGTIPIVGSYVIESVSAYANTAPTGTAVIVDVNRNGVTIYGTPANRPTIAAGAKAATVGAHSVTTVGDGDRITVDVDQIGATVAGADLVVTVRLRKTA